MSGFVCSECGECFDTAKGRRTHSHQKHNNPDWRSSRSGTETSQGNNLDEAAVEDGQEAFIRHTAGKRERARMLKEEEEASTSGRAGCSTDPLDPEDPARHPGGTCEDLQKAELDLLYDWQQRSSQTLMNEMKRSTAELTQARCSNLSKWLEGKLLEQGITHESTLKEIADEVQRQMSPWQGLETAHREAARRKQVCPTVTPVKRPLQTKQGKAKHVDKAKEEAFVYDVPVEKHIQLEFSTRPQRYHEARLFLKQQQLKQQAAPAVVDDEWEVDDYYTSINGLLHPCLGKSDNWLGMFSPSCHCPSGSMLVSGVVGFVSYADGIDIVKNALSIFAGKRSVVVFILVMLSLAPATRLQVPNLHVATVAYASDCKSQGYDEVVGGNVSNPACSSIGGSMRRFHTGIEFATPDSQEPTWLAHGGLYGCKGDNPQISSLLSMKEAFGDDVKSPCNQCNIKGEQFTAVDLNKSYLHPTDPPFQIRYNIHSCYLLHCIHC